MPHQYVFRALLALSCAYAFWRGRGDERIVAAVCLFGTLASRLALSPLTSRYSGVEGGLLFVDLVVLATFVMVALRSSRFWPLWVAGLQLTSSMAHVVKAMDGRLLPIAYGAAIAFWSYPILIILAVATWRRSRREMNEAAALGAATSG